MSDTDDFLIADAINSIQNGVREYFPSARVERRNSPYDDVVVVATFDCGSTISCRIKNGARGLSIRPANDQKDSIVRSAINVIVLQRIAAGERAIDAISRREIER